MACPRNLLLLFFHPQVHWKLNAIMERQPRRRRRAALSCVECRRRKIKCDRQDPCSHCVASQVQCTFRLFNDSTAAPARQRQHRQVDAAQLELSPRGVQENESETANTYPRSPTIETQTGIKDVEDSNLIINKTRVLRAGIAKDFESLIACFLAAIGTRTGVPIDNGDLHLGESVYHSSALAPTVDKIGSMLEKCKDAAKRIKAAANPVATLTGLDFDLSNLTLPSRDTAHTMTLLYFEHFESAYRILHQPTFWAEHIRFWIRTETVEPALRLKYLLVVAIGSSLHEGINTGADTTWRGMVHQWIRAAQAWLAGPLKKDRLSITGLQIHCLALLARQIFSVGADLVWMSMGELIHKAMQLGLHRDPKHLPPMPVLEAEVRRRLWASIVELAVQSSLDAAMPARISPAEFDTEPPANINDDEMDESTTTLVSHPRATTYTDTSMQLILLDSLPTRLAIVQLLNGLHGELSYSQVLALSSGITEACRKATASFAQGYTQHSEDSAAPFKKLTPFHASLHDYLVRRFLLPLHRPFAMKAQENPLFASSVKVSLDTAMGLIAHGSINDNTLPSTSSPGVNMESSKTKFARLLLVGSGLFREGLWYAMSAIMLELYVAVSSAYDADYNPNNRRNPSSSTNHVAPHASAPLPPPNQLQRSYIAVLKQAVQDLIVIFKERIKEGETNVKGYLFLRMALAKVEAVESGAVSASRGGFNEQTVALAVAQTGVDSLEVAYFLLRERAVKLGVPLGTGVEATGHVPMDETLLSSDPRYNSTGERTATTAEGYASVSVSTGLDPEKGWQINFDDNGGGEGYGMYGMDMETWDFFLGQAFFC